MKKSNGIITLLAAIILNIIYSAAIAQKISGKATYETTSGITLDFSGNKDFSPEQQKKMKEKLAKAGQKTYELSFNENESVYQQQEKLGDLGGTGTGTTSIRILNLSNGKGNRSYKNIAEQISVSERSISDKLFLVEDKLTVYQWELQDEFKQIGSYSCQKATFNRIEEKEQFSFSNVEEAETTMVMDTTHIEAWFTPQIPVKHGPSKFHGLPGLIMELSNGRKTYICSKIELQQGISQEIEQPSKGKKISQEEFDVIQRKKLKQFTQLYKGKNEGDITIKMKN